MTEDKRVSDAVIHLLAKLTAEAKAGNIAAIATITVSPEGAPITRFAGERELTPMVNLGIDMMKATIMQQILGAPGAVQENSGIIKASH